MKTSLQLIEAFLMVAKYKSITQAARMHFVTQPAMSLYINDLEKKLGVKLFSRTNRGVKLTPVGEKLFAEIEPIYMRFILSVDYAVERHVRNPERQALKVGSYHSPDYMAIMHGIVMAFTDINSQTPLSTEYYSGGAMCELLLCREIDVALIPQFEVADNPDIQYKMLKQPELFLAVPTVWNVSGISDLDDRVLLLEPNRSRNASMDVCRANNIEPSGVEYASNLLLLSNLIASGKGFTVCEHNLPAINSDRVLFIPLLNSGNNSGYAVCAARRRGETSGALAELISIIENSDWSNTKFDPRHAISKWY